LKQVETEMDLPVQPTTPKSHQKSGIFLFFFFFNFFKIIK